MLTVISSVRQSNTKINLEAETAFSFVHPNYSRYLPHQKYVLFTIHHICSILVKKEFKENSFSCSLAGGMHSKQHRSFVVETKVNSDVKVYGIPLQGRYSID